MMRRLPQRVPVCIVLEAQMVDDLRGRRVRLVTAEDQWHDDTWHVWNAGIELDTQGHAYVEVIPAEEFWRMRHTRKVNVSRVRRWPANAVFLD